MGVNCQRISRGQCCGNPVAAARSARKSEELAPESSTADNIRAERYATIAELRQFKELLASRFPNANMSEAFEGLFGAVPCVNKKEFLHGTTAAAIGINAEKVFNAMCDMNDEVSIDMFDRSMTGLTIAYKVYVCKEIGHAETTMNEETVRSGSKQGARPVTALKSALRKVQTAVRTTIDDLKEFRKFIKEQYATPGEAYDAFADGAPYIDSACFVCRARALRFPGNSENIFISLANNQGHITRKSFQQKLKSVSCSQKLVDVIHQAADGEKDKKRGSPILPRSNAVHCRQDE